MVIYWRVHFSTLDYTHQSQRPLIQAHAITVTQSEERVWEDADGNKIEKEVQNRKKLGGVVRGALRADCISLSWHKGKQRKHCPAARFRHNSPHWKASIPFSEGGFRFTAWQRQQIMVETQPSGNERCSLDHNWQVCGFRAPCFFLFDQKTKNWTLGGD